MKTSVKYVIISDTETGGLPSKDRRAVFDVALLEVSCCVIDMELLEIIEEYDNLIKPDYKDNLILSCEALAVNGIELDVLESSGVALQQVYKDLKSLFVKYKNPRHKAILGGHNFDGFDFDFFKNLFEFAGDDDVWVFIDGKLVLDIGGIHDSVNGTINFAQNKTEISATSSGQTSGMFIKGGRSTAGKISKKVFRDSEGAGIFDTTLKTFAATDQHTLTVYYLERGEGASNCKIKFNLPMKDTVSVHKTVKTTDSKGIKLDDSILAQISQRDFYFTLYRDGEAVSDATYNLYDINNHVFLRRKVGEEAWNAWTQV